MGRLSIEQARAQLGTRLSAHGLPLTDQRRVIFEALFARDDHPTAELIHMHVRRTLPRISLATVYRTLETFADLGLVLRVAHPGSAARYDAKLHRHHHLLCDGCGGLFDVESRALDDVRLPDFDSAGVVVRNHAFQLRGLCRTCAQKKGKGATR
jgi:Fur family transcriptional regulator, peroxide stress response regulator